MRNILNTVLFVCAGAIAVAAQSVVPAEVVKDLAPSGKLRAAINLVNTVIAQRDPAGGDPKGVSVDLARELARRLGVPIEFVIFDGAGKEFDAAGSDTWDIGFFGIDPLRAADVDYTAPYVLIQGGYMVRKDSPVQNIPDADRAGTRIAVGRDSVYDLYLTSALKNAQLVRVPEDLNAVVDAFFNEKLEVAAFITIPLANYVKDNPNVRMVDGVFMEIKQAVATPKGRGEAGLLYLHSFVEDVKSSGFVAESLKRSGEIDAAVAPAAKADACEPLSPTYRSDSSRVVTEKIGPTNSPGPTGNTFFLMPQPYKYVIVHLNPTSSDVGTYLVKLITRYTDDTIYEPVVQTIVPKAGGNYTWGPLAVMPSAVPGDKIANMFNVKVQENYALNPEAKGFSYTVSVDGCN